MRSTRNSSAIWVGAAAMIVSVILLGSMTVAQVQTDTTTTKGTASKTVKVENGEVVYVSGNTLVVKMADGSLRHFNHVPDSARVTVDGKQLSVHDLRVGMKLQRTITTTTTPETIKTVQTVTGTVWHVNPPLSVILTLEDGKNQEFKIPEGQKFNVNGQMTDAWGLQPGMKISATKVVESPTEVVTQQAKLTGVMPPPPPPPPADQPILVVEEITVPVQTAEATPAPAQPASLPKTGSSIPLIGLLGFLSFASALGLRAFRVR